MKETLNVVLMEWKSKKRRMNCEAATDWFCKRTWNFKPLQKSLYTKEGTVFTHIVATDGIIEIDLVPKVVN